MSRPSAVCGARLVFVARGGRPDRRSVRWKCILGLHHCQMYIRFFFFFHPPPRSPTEFTRYIPFVLAVRIFVLFSEKKTPATSTESNVRGAVKRLRLYIDYRAPVSLNYAISENRIQRVRTILYTPVRGRWPWPKTEGKKKKVRKNSAIRYNERVIYVTINFFFFVVVFHCFRCRSLPEDVRIGVM